MPPFVTLPAPLEFRQLLCFAAIAVEQPHLVPFRFSRTRGGERDVFAVRTPAWRGLAVLAESYLPVVLAIKANQPDVRVALVIFGVNRCDHISDPLTVWRDLRIAHFTKTLDVVELDWMTRRLGSEHSQRNQNEH